MKSLLAFAILFVFAVQQSYTVCHWREINLCAATMALFSQGNSLIPDTEESVETFCTYVQDAHNCIGNYSQKCMTAQIREVAGIFIEGSVLFTQDFCKKGSAAQKHWLKYAPCLAEHSDEATPCIDEVLASIENLGNIEPKDRLTALCCTVEKVLQCVNTRVEKNCGKDAVDMIEIMLKNFITEFPLIMCKPFDPKSERCIPLLPAPGTKTAGSESESALVRLLSAYFGN